MKPFAKWIALGMGLAVSACASVDTATRNAVMEERPAPVIEAVTEAAQQMPLNVTSVRVSVPQTLKVSEANMYYPLGDIVWREDPMGDRHAQVQALVQAAIERGTAVMTQGVPVVMEVEIERFHALSEKARYTVGGRHEIEMSVTLRQAETGMILDGPRHLETAFDAYGGQKALEAERNGITQRSRISEHLAGFIQKTYGVPLAPPAAPDLLAEATTPVPAPQI